jgi:uncharacterized protein (DUF2461 family)
VFEGFPDEHREFFAAVAEDTRWDVVQSRAAQHERAIRGPMQGLAEELEPEFGRAKVYNLHRSPRYWVEQWAYVERVDTIAYGVSLSADGLWVEGGWLLSSPDQVPRYRDAVDAHLEEIATDLRSHGYELLGVRLKRAPSELLAYRSLVAGRQLGSGTWLQTREPVQRVRDEWRRLRPLVDWLTEHVGPRAR